MGENIIEGLHRELARCREILKMYRDIDTGAFGARMIELEISQTEASIADGDVVAMIRCYKSLQEVE